MILRQASLLLAALSLPLCAAQPKPAAEVLNLSGKWEINYDTDSCHLLAQFGEGPAAIAIRFTRFEPGPTFTLDLFGERFFRLNRNPAVSIQFQPTGAPRKVGSLVADSGSLTALLLGKFDLTGYPYGGGEFTPPRNTPEDEAAITALELRVDDAKPITLQFGSLGKPFQALRTCTENLVRQWGYDPAVLATLKTAAQPANNPARWVTFKDYPSKALANRLSGIVDFRLDVDDRGHVTNCAIIASTQPADFKAATCNAMIRRARFTPATAADGTPVRSFYINRVRWITF